jgi:precorrin-2 dehydrogenase/sirohydrochlorin ferrochelatase
MLVDFKLNGKCVVVVGGGSEGYRKTMDFVDEGAKILVVSKTFSNEVAKLGEEGKVCLQKETVEDAETFVNSFDPKPYLFVAVTDDPVLNAQLIKAARALGFLVYAPDNPAVSDLILPAVAKIGDVKVAISTGGKSPAMARLLRQKIEKMIKPQDLVQIQLQSQLREDLKKQVADQKTRKKLLYMVLEDATVKKLLEAGQLSQAQERAMEMVQKQKLRK